MYQKVFIQGWFEIIKEYKAWNLQKYLIDYRVHSGGITKMHQEEKLEKEKRVFQILFKQLGIDATEQEIGLHLLIRDNKPVTNINTLKSIEEWLLKIVTYNTAFEVYNRKMLARIVNNRWLKVCYKARGLHFSMLHLLFTSEIISIFTKSFRSNNND